MEAARQWNAETIDGLLQDPDWQKLPVVRQSKERDALMKSCGLRILDSYMSMSEDLRESKGFVSMVQEVHEAPFDDVPRTRRPSNSIPYMTRIHAFFGSCA